MNEVFLDGMFICILVWYKTIFFIASIDIFILVT